MPQNPTDLTASKTVSLSPMNITDKQIVLVQAQIDNIELLNTKHNFLVDEAQVEFNAIKTVLTDLETLSVFDLDSFNDKFAALINIIENPSAGVLSAFDKLYDELNRRSEIVTAVQEYNGTTGFMDIDLTGNNLSGVDAYEISTTTYGDTLVKVRVEKTSATSARAYITDSEVIQSPLNTSLPYDGTVSPVKILFKLIRVPVQITKTFAPDVDGGDVFTAGGVAAAYVLNVSPTLEFVANKGFNSPITPTAAGWNTATHGYDNFVDSRTIEIYSDGKVTTSIGSITIVGIAEDGTETNIVVLADSHSSIADLVKSTNTGFTSLVASDLDVFESATAQSVQITLNNLSGFREIAVREEAFLGFPQAKYYYTLS